MFFNKELERGWSDFTIFLKQGTCAISNYGSTDDEITIVEGRE